MGNVFEQFSTFKALSNLAGCCHLRPIHTQNCCNWQVVLNFVASSSENAGEKHKLLFGNEFCSVVQNKETKQAQQRELTKTKPRTCCLLTRGFEPRRNMPQAVHSLKRLRIGLKTSFKNSGWINVFCAGNQIDDAMLARQKKLGKARKPRGKCNHSRSCAPLGKLRDRVGLLVWKHEPVNLTPILECPPTPAAA